MTIFEDMTNEENVKQIRLAADLIKSGADDFKIDTTLTLVGLVNRTAVQKGINCRAARKFLIDLINQGTGKMNDETSKCLIGTIHEMRAQERLTHYQTHPIFVKEDA